jgi:MFS family permease
MLCIAWLLFNIGQSMVNTEYAASLHIHGISESGVFFIVLIAMILQTVLFYYALKILYRNKLREEAGIMVGLRAVSYIFIGVSFLTGGLIFFVANLVLYTAVAGLSYPLYYTASYTLLFMAIGDNKRGGALGLYNGIGWVGYFLGALFTGATLFAGFDVVYVIAGLWIFGSLYVLSKVPSASMASKPSVPVHATA